MASNKKRGQKSKVKGSAPRSYSDLYKDGGTADGKSVEKAAGAGAVEASANADVINWSTEYGYVLKDLRHLAIVSTTLFLVMLVVGFLL